MYSDIKMQNVILRFLFVQFINSKADVWKYKMRRLTPNEKLSGTQISELKILWSTLVLFQTTCDIFQFFSTNLRDLNRSAQKLFKS